MSNENYISKEVSKIINNEAFKSPQNYAMAAAWILGNLKGVNLKVLKVQKQSSLADYFIMASGTNVTQIRAMSDEIITQFKKHDLEPISKEGMEDGDWALIDLGEIIVHIFSDLSRDVYDLDSLWDKAEQIDIPNEYYFSSSDEPAKPKKESDEDYF